MEANRFFSVSYDIRHHPHVSMLEDLNRKGYGDGMAAFGRYVALLSILYDEGGAVVLDDGPMTNYLARELEFPDVSALAKFLSDCARVGLIDPAAYQRGTVTSQSVTEQIAFRKTKAEARKTGGRQRKADGKAPRKAP